MTIKERLLPKSLVNCTKLEVLDLGNNNINDLFPYWLEALTTLRVLVLKSNRFYGPIGNHNISGYFSLSYEFLTSRKMSLMVFYQEIILKT